jgi:hypothetical protein
VVATLVVWAVAVDAAKNPTASSINKDFIVLLVDKLLAIQLPSVNNGKKRLL